MRTIRNSSSKFQDAEPTAEIGAIRDWGADELLKHLKVRPSRDSNVIYMQFTSDSPQKAADIANAFADSYLQTSLELKVDPARRQAGWFDQQVDDLRVALEKAQSKLSAYQGEHGVIGTDDARLDVENARLTEIANHLVAAQAAMYDAETRQRQMKEALAKDLADAAVNVLSNPLLQNLKTELARAEAKFANVAQRYDRNHPQYMSAQAELESLRARSPRKSTMPTRAVAREAQIARQDTSDLQRAMDQQRKRILDLQHNQDEFLVLKRDAESARAAYDSALQHGSQTRLESRLDHTTIAILNYAFPPLDPAWPLLLLNLVLAVILGSMLGAGVSLTRERLDRRIRSCDDLLEGADIAVLAELPRVRALPRKQRRRSGGCRQATAGGARIAERKRMASTKILGRRAPASISLVAPSPVDTQLGELLHGDGTLTEQDIQADFCRTTGKRRAFWRGGIALGAGERAGRAARARPAC